MCNEQVPQEDFVTHYQSCGHVLEREPFHEQHEAAVAEEDVLEELRCVRQEQHSLREYVKECTLRVGTLSATAKNLEQDMRNNLDVLSARVLHVCKEAAGLNNAVKSANRHRFLALACLLPCLLIACHLVVAVDSVKKGIDNLLQEVLKLKERRGAVVNDNALLEKIAEMVKELMKDSGKFSKSMEPSRESNARGARGVEETQGLTQYR